MIDQTTLKSIEDLHRLKTEGIISEEEFERSKEKLLFGGRAGPANSPATAISAVFGPPPVGLPADDDHVGWITLPLKNYADFNGRSTRKEFWMFQLIHVALLAIAYVAVMSGGDVDASGAALGLSRLVMIVVFIAFLGLVVPLLAVEARRFHDQNRSAWFVALNLVSYVGVIIVAVMMLIEGTRGDNRFGPDPKAS